MGYLQSRYVFVHKPLEAFYRFKARRVAALVASLGQKMPRTFLDLGSGCGDLAHGVRTEFSAAVGGIEQDPDMTRRARERGEGEFLSGNLLDVVDQLRSRFGLIVSFEVFEHLTFAEHAKAFAMFRAYSIPGGLGVIMVPNAANPFLGGWIAWSDYTHRSCFTAESLAQFLRAQGVREAKVSPWYSAGSPWLLTIRRGVGTCLGFIYKKALGLLSTSPAATDPFVDDPFPMSSHITAVFKIPDGE